MSPKNNNKKKSIQRFFLVFVGIYFLVCGYFYYQQNSLLYHPNEQDFLNCPEMEEKGGEAIAETYEGENLRFYTRKAPRAHGWFIAFHGNAGSACERAYFLDTPELQRLHIVVVEYPGFSRGGANLQGRPSQETILKNAVAVVDYLKPKLPVFLFGESLGTGIATYVASQRKEVSGLILQAPYPSITAVGKDRFPFLPVSILLKDPFPAQDWAKSVTQPTLVFHGITDRSIPYSLGREQVTHFPNVYRLVTFEKGGHNRLRAENTRRYEQVTRQFISDTLKNHAKL